MTIMRMRHKGQWQQTYHTIRPQSYENTKQFLDGTITGPQTKLQNKGILGAEESSELWRLTQRQ